MPFQTHDMLAAQHSFLYFTSLESQLRERAPELAGRIERPDVPPLYIKVALDSRTGILMAPTVIGGGGAWCIADPKYPSWSRVWSLDTPDEILVEAMRSRAAAWISGAPEKSPWRWDEPEETLITRLADLLLMRNLEPQIVVAKNRCYVIEAPTSDGRAIRIPRRAQGDFLLVQEDHLQIRVALKAGLGWVLDVRGSEAGFWRRVDIGGHLSGQVSSVPGVAPTAISLEALSELVAAAADDLRPDSVPATTRRPKLSPPLPATGEPGEHPAPAQVQNVAEQLRAMGFGDVEVSSNGSALCSATQHIVWWERPKEPGLSDLQRLNGLAAAEDKKLMLIVANRVTRPAEDFATQAKAFVFSVDSRSGCLRGANSLGEEAQLPGWTDWILRRYRLEDSSGIMPLALDWE